MQAELIDPGEFLRAGEGAVGESYNLKDNEAVMVKLSAEGCPAEFTVREYEMSLKAFEAGIPTPRPYGLVTDGQGRYGIRFERIAGKKSYCRASSDDPAGIPKFGREFGRLCRDLHQIHLPKGYVPDVKDKYRTLLSESRYYTDSEKDRIRAFIDSAPDSDVVNHGDLQYGNAIRVEGDGGLKQYFIDMGEFSMGHPYFDLGQVLFCCKFSDPGFILDVFHLNMEQASGFWDSFVKGYWGEDADPDRWESVIRPYAGLKTLLIQSIFDAPFPHYKRLLMESI